MNRFVRVAATAAIAVGGAGSVGCVHTDTPADSDKRHGDGMRYRNWVDPCWPERYNDTARREVVAPFAAQVNNGHILNHTVWNWYFEPGTDKLTTAGMAKLDSIAMERPAPDGRLYLQTARDLIVTPQNQDKLGELRNDLTVKRAASVQKYMASQPTINAVSYELYVHDLPTAGMSAEFAASSYRGQQMGYRGGLSAGGGTAALSTGNGGLQQPAAPTADSGSTGTGGSSGNSGSGGTSSTSGGGGSGMGGMGMGGGGPMP